MTRFLWLNNAETAFINDKTLEVYQFCRVPFGVVPSPFLLAATITHHLKHVDSPIPELFSVIYTLIMGVQRVSEGVKLYTEAKEIFSTATMNLKQWA